MGGEAGEGGRGVVRPGGGVPRCPLPAAQRRFSVDAEAGSWGQAAKGRAASDFESPDIYTISACYVYLRAFP